MGFSLFDLAQTGAAFTRQQAVNRQKKQQQRQGLMHFLQLAQAQREREASANQIQTYRAQAAETTAERQAQAERDRASELGLRADQFDRRLSFDEQNAGDNRELRASTDAERQRAEAQRLELARQAEELRKLTAGTNAKYTADRDAQVRPTAAEHVRHDKATEQIGAGGLHVKTMTLSEARRAHDQQHSLSQQGLSERERHDSAEEAQGEQRIGQGEQRIGQGAARIGQGAKRLTLSQARQGGKAGGDPVEVIQKRLTELARRAKPSKDDAVLGIKEPALIDSAEGKAEMAHLMNQRHRLLSQPMPVTAVIPGVGNVPIPPAGLGALPGSRPTLRQVLPQAEEHHSHSQPRHPKTGKFQPGNLRALSTKQLFKMLGQ